MKIFTSPLLTLLLLYKLNNHQVQSRTMVDLMFDMMTDTFPCIPPCVAENADEMIQAYLQDCLPQAKKDIEPLFAQMSSATTDNFALPQQINDPKFICDTTTEIEECPKRIFVKYCGSDIVKRVDDTVAEALKGLGCGKSGDTMMTCGLGLVKELTRKDSPTLPKIFACVNEVQVNHKATLAKFESSYPTIYDDILSKQNSELCDIADTFLKCALPVIGQVSGCRDGVTDQMKAESESLLTLASCRDRSSYYDGMKCFANPRLHADVGTCFGKTNLGDLANSVKYEEGPPMKIGIDVTKLCPITNYMDKCLKEPLMEHCAKEEKKWSYETYESLTTPTRDYLLIRACKTPEKASFAEGAGSCKNKFNDFTFGEKDPNYSSASIVSAHFKVTLLGLMGMIWMMNN